MTDRLYISPGSFRELKALYAKAVEEGAESFEFQGKTLLTSYAKYLIQYLEDYM